MSSSHLADLVPGFLPRVASASLSRFANSGQHMGSGELGERNKAAPSLSARPPHSVSLGTLCLPPAFSSRMTGVGDAACGDGTLLSAR